MDIKNNYLKNNYLLVLVKRAALFLLVAIIGSLLVSGMAFATTSIKYGWIALDSSKKPVLQGSQYVLAGTVKPIKFISNGSGEPIAVNDKAVVYLSNTKAGTSQALVLGDKIVSGYKDAFITTFTIVNPVDISKATIADIPKQTYTGNQIKPKITVTYNGKTLKEGSEYEVAYKNNVNAGTARAAVRRTTKKTDNSFFI